MSKFTSNKIFLACLVLLTAINVLQWGGQTIQRLANPPAVPFHTLGYQFMGLEKIFQDHRYVGYYTDKNMDISLAIAQFEQAQYMLSPTVLDLNNTSHFFTIFDCTSPQVAMAKIKDLGLQPVSVNHTGIILAVNPLQAKAAKP